MERLWRPISRLKFYPTLKINLTRTNKLCTKQTPQPVIITLFNSLKRLWWPLSLNPASGETLTTTPLHNQTREDRPIWKRIFEKVWRPISTKPTQLKNRHNRHQMSSMRKPLRPVLDEKYITLWTCPILTISKFCLDFERLVNIKRGIKFPRSEI